MSDDSSGKVKWWVSGIVGPIIVGLVIWYFTGPNSPFQNKPHPHPPRQHAAYGTISTTAGYNANVYSNPSLGAEIVAEVGRGQPVQIRCTSQGQVVTGNGQSSSLWDYVGNGYIPDVLVYTGTDQPTMPNC